MRYFPMSYDTKNKTALIIGGDSVALSKIRDLLQSEFKIYVIAEKFLEDIIKLSNTYPERIYLKQGRIDGSFVFFGYDYLIIATHNFDLNQALEERAQKSNIPYERCDVISSSNLLMNKVIYKEGLTIGITTNNINPTITDIVYHDIENLLSTYSEEKILILNEIRRQLIKRNALNVDGIIRDLYYQEKFVINNYLDNLEHDEEYNKEVAEIKDELNSKINEIKDDYELNSESNEKQENISEKEPVKEKERNKMKDELKKIKDNISDKFESEKITIEDKIEEKKKKDELREIERQEAMEKATDEAYARIDQMEADRAKRFAETKEQHEKDREAIKEKFEKDKKELKDKIEEHKEEAKEKHDERREERIEKSVAKEVELKDKKENMKDKIEEHKEEAKEKHNEHKHEFKEKMEAEKNKIIYGNDEIKEDIKAEAEKIKGDAEHLKKK